MFCFFSLCPPLFLIVCMLKRQMYVANRRLTLSRVFLTVTAAEQGIVGGDGTGQG